MRRLVCAAACAALLPLHGHAILLNCLSRVDCDDPSEVCVRGAVAVGRGFCAPCGSLNASQCLPPCYAWGSACRTDRLAVALRLDEQPPFYFVAAGAVSKAAVQLAAFPPTKEASFAGVKGRAKLAAQWAFAAMAVNNCVQDVKKIVQVVGDALLSRWQRFLGSIVVVVLSPNMPATVGGAAQFMFLGSGHEETFDSSNQKSFGPVFACYVICLILTYGILACCASLLAFVAGIVYPWVLVPGCAGIWVVTWTLSKATARVLKRRRGYLDLTDALLKDIDESRRPTDSCVCTEENLSGYYGYLMALPVVQFLIITFVRLLDGYGYFRAVYLTLTERHIAAYLDVSAMSVWNGMILVWLFV